MVTPGAIISITVSLQELPRNCKCGRWPIAAKVVCSPPGSDIQTTSFFYAVAIRPFSAVDLRSRCMP